MTAQGQETSQQHVPLWAEYFLFTMCSSACLSHNIFPWEKLDSNMCMPLCFKRDEEAIHFYVRSVRLIVLCFSFLRTAQRLKIGALSVHDCKVR